jgi:hypothetical protein
MKREIVLLMAMCLTIGSLVSAAPQEKPQQGVGLTIYNDNFAVVRESRPMAFEQGTNIVKFTDVASAIDPTSVSFKSLSSPGAVSILEQNYEYDLVNSDSLLKRYIDKKVTIELKGSGADTSQEITGVLMAAMGNDLILKNEKNEIQIVDKTSTGKISLRELPDDLVTRPTLVWLADSKEKGQQLCQVTYTTGRVGWNADYLAVLNADETKIDFSGWVTIDNKSGAGYKDATIKLIAGDVRRVVEPVPMERGRMVYAMKGGADQAGFEEKPFMEYHLYTLGRKSTVNNNQVKQIEFITPASGVPSNKIYIYERKPRWFYENKNQKDKVNVKIEFENTRENGLGIALPKGKIRVFKKDPADGTLEFVGEDKIDHTPAKEKLSLYIGDAFDIVPQYTLVDGKYGEHYSRETHKIELRNRKQSAVTVYVDEKLTQGRNWTIEKSTHEYKKRDVNTIRFEVKIEADSTAAIEYTVTETW